MKYTTENGEEIILNADELLAEIKSGKKYEDEHKFSEITSRYSFLHFNIMKNKLRSHLFCLEDRHENTTIEVRNVCSPFLIVFHFPNTPVHK